MSVLSRRFKRAQKRPAWDFSAVNKIGLLNQASWKSAIRNVYSGLGVVGLVVWNCYSFKIFWTLLIKDYKTIWFTYQQRKIQLMLTLYLSYCRLIKKWVFFTNVWNLTTITTYTTFYLQLYNSKYSVKI